MNVLQCPNDITIDPIGPNIQSVDPTPTIVTAPGAGGTDPAPIAFTVGLNREFIDKTGKTRLSEPGQFEAVTGGLLELSQHISRGFAWMPAVLDGGARRKQEFANSADAAALDIDDGMTIAEALTHPFIAAHCGLLQPSASHTAEHHKYRLIFVYPHRVEGYQTIRICNSYLAHVVGSADRACKDASRFFFGAKGSQPALVQEVLLPERFVQDALAWDETETVVKPQRDPAPKKIATETRAAEQGDATLMMEALQAIPPDCDYNDWIAIGMALAGILGAGGFNVWDSWSSGGSNYDAGQMAPKWESFAGSTGDPATIFGIAKHHGWRFPRAALPVTSDTMAAAFAKFEGKQLNANSDPVKTEAKVLGINNYKLFRAYERHQDGFDVEWLIENLPLNSEAHKKAEKKYRRDNGLDGDGGGTVADRLISIAIDAGVTYFQTDDKTVYAEVTTGSKLDTWPIDSTDFRDFLRRSIYERDSVTISADALTQAIATIGAINKNICPEKQIYVRAAKQDGAVYLSMSDRDCRAVKITAAGWEITQTYPVRFKAGAGVAIPDPVRGGSLELLRELCNFNFDTWVLMLTFLIQWLYSTKGYPILFLVAEANSGKTTIAEALKKLVDPSSVNIMPRVPDERDLAIHASRRRVILIDNVSRFDEAQSNNLCCIATGAGFSTRTLQSNDQETVLPLNNPMIFTGIADMASKGDLLSRGLTAKLQTPPPDKMMSQEAFADRFEAIRPGVSGALFDLLSQVLAVLPTVQGTYKGRERFGTFVELGLAIEQVLGWPVGTVLRVIGDGRESAHEATIEASPVGLALMDMMTGAEVWTGSATTLLTKLTGMVPENVARGKFWPSDPTRLSRKLSELRASFAALGLEITSTKSSGARLVAIKRVPTAPTQTAILPVGTPIGPLELGDWDVPLEQVQEGDSYQFEYEPEGS
jgi:hypothetical protein